MATIAIRTKILDGNLGEGWKDTFQAAQALAQFTRETWQNDLREFSEAGHEIEVNVEVCRNTTGYDGGVSVYCDDADIERAAEQSMTGEPEIWEAFCSAASTQGLV